MCARLKEVWDVLTTFGRSEGVLNWIELPFSTFWHTAEGGKAGMQTTQWIGNRFLTEHQTT